jgi:RsiW-degrading membrane proteinase PrsW (M82 family)
LIACTSLIVQVFFELITAIFFGGEITIHYSTSDTLQHTLFIMFVAASIEEIIRYVFIKYKTVPYIDKHLRDSVIHGVLLGFGFASLEILFIYLSKVNIFENLQSISYVVVTHTLLSIFLLYFTSQRKPVKQDIVFVILAIIAHIGINVFLFYHFI